MNQIINVILLAAAPISELRGAIPLAIGVYHWPWWPAVFWSVIGNMIPVFFILWLLEPVSNWLRKNFVIFEKFFLWLFKYTRDKHKQKFEVYRDLALIILVAIPLPMTGAWTGSLAAFVFGIPYCRALPLIFIGVLIAATVVTLATLGIVNIDLK